MAHFQIGRTSRYTAFAAIAILSIALVGIGAAAADPTSPPPTPAKASSPGTDLQNYPKLPVTTTDPASSSDTSTDVGVLAVTNFADGSSDITSYTPAPGVSDVQLYKMLKAQGVSDLLDPATTSNNTVANNSSTARSAAVTPAAAACTIGTAHTNGCPGIHWANNGYAHPQVYFVDHTGAGWPVDAATYNWNQAQGRNSQYLWIKIF